MYLWGAATPRSHEGGPTGGRHAASWFFFESQGWMCGLGGPTRPLAETGRGVDVLLFLPRKS